jgi:hypothetical protein
MTATTDTFEDRLHDALLERFEGACRPLSIGPRRALAPRYVIPVAGLVAAATAASLTLVEFGGKSPSRPVESSNPGLALASWTAHPTAAAPTQVSAAEDYCLVAFGQSPGSPSDTTKAGPLQSDGPWTADAVDTRGDLTLALFSDSTQTVACLSGPTFVWLDPLYTGAGAPVGSGAAGLDKVIVRQVPGAVYTVAVGVAGTAVTGVGLKRVDGSQVTATIGDGHFLAWWPDGMGVKGLEVTTTAGTQDQPVAPSFARSAPQPTNRTFHDLP